MILRNYYNLLVMSMAGYKGEEPGAYGDGHLNRHVMNGGIVNWTLSGFDFNLSNITRVLVDTWETTGYSSSLGFVFGTNDTPVTFDDYAMSFITTLSFKFAKGQASVPVYNASEKSWSFDKAFILQNTGSESVTIREIGIAQPLLRTVATTGVATLMYREVLENPITIGAGEVFEYTHTFTIKFPQETN